MTDAITLTFGSYLKGLRSSRNMTLREVGERADVDHAYIHRLEMADKYRPSDDMINRLLNALSATDDERRMLNLLARNPDSGALLMQAEKAEAERDELQACANLYWDASMRAISMWQHANPGNDMIWPDKARGEVWLMMHIVDLRQALTRIAKAVWRDRWETCATGYDQYNAVCAEVCPILEGIGMVCEEGAYEFIDDEHEPDLFTDLIAANQIIAAVAEWLNENPGSYDAGDALTADNVKMYLGDVDGALLAELRAEVSTLTAENERLKLLVDPEALTIAHMHGASISKDEIGVLKARILELEEALEPFIREFPGWINHEDNERIYDSICVGDLRHAASLCRKGEW